MKMNQEYRDVMRRGRWVLNKATYRKQQQSGIIVSLCLISAVVFTIVAIIVSLGR